MSAAPVRRRHVFFLSGFDPKGAGYYHALYARNAAIQGGITDSLYRVSQRQRSADGNATWQVRHSAASESVETTYEYVRWDDLVRAHWPRRGWNVASAALAAYWAILCSGRLAQVRAVAPRTLVPLAFPLLFWLAMSLLACAGALAAATLWPGSSGTRALAVVAVACGVLAAAIALERRLNSSWLLRIYRFVHLLSLGRVQGLDERLDRLAARIDERLRDPAMDEVLVVGFSVGSILAVSAVGRAVEGTTAPAGKLALLTLGHCIPMLGLMPAAARFRAELARLAHEPRMTWLDYSSPTDWGSFALVDPVPLCLGEPAAAPARRRFASPRFHCLFAPEAYRAMRRDKRRMHLQYLMAGDRAGDYDYFTLTAGPMSLRTRCAPGNGG